MESDESVTLSTIVTAFTDFLTVAIHTILYERTIYPQSSFLTARKYNYSVRQNRHPKVCQWIQDAVTAIESELLHSSVERIALVILSPLQLPLERFVFEVSRFPVVEPEEVNIPLAREGVSPQASVIDLKEQFRGAMSRLSVCGGRLKPLPKSCSFTIAIEIKEFQDPPIGHPQSFIPVQPMDRSQGPPTSLPKDCKTANTSTDIIPVRTVETHDMHLEMWIEEVQNKGSSEST